MNDLTLLYLCLQVKQDLDRVVRLILYENVNVVLPPDEEPALIDGEGDEPMLFEHYLKAPKV